MSYKKLLIDTAKYAGESVLKIFNSNFNVDYKKDNSPITEADLLADKIIVEALKETEIPIISEESVSESYNTRKKYKEFWLIDPIDGTKQFIKKEKEFTVNIARIKNNKIAEGIVYAPALNCLYYGLPGTEAVKIIYDRQVSTTHNLPYISTGSETVVLASKSHLNSQTEKFLTELKSLMPAVIIKNIGSSVKLCKIAEGSADIHLRLRGINEWDIAAGHAVLKAAGGNIFNFSSGNEVTYNSHDLKEYDYFAILDAAKYKEVLMKVKV